MSQSSHSLTHFFHSKFEFVGSSHEQRLVFETGKELPELTASINSELREELKIATEALTTEGEGGAAEKRWDDVWSKIKREKRLRRLKDAADKIRY